MRGISCKQKYFQTNHRQFCKWKVWRVCNLVTGGFSFYATDRLTITSAIFSFHFYPPSLPSRHDAMAGGHYPSIARCLSPLRYPARRGAFHRYHQHFVPFCKLLFDLLDLRWFLCGSKYYRPPFFFVSSASRFCCWNVSGSLDGLFNTW